MSTRTFAITAVLLGIMVFAVLIALSSRPPPPPAAADGDPGVPVPPAPAVKPTVHAEPEVAAALATAAP